jgi:hypothetical protein
MHCLAVYRVAVAPRVGRFGEAVALATASGEPEASNCASSTSC